MIAASIDFASADTDDLAMRHHHHRDVFPERAPGMKGPDATAVLYLSQAPDGYPTRLSAPTIFPRVGVTVTPRAGSLLAWANVREDGAADENAEHGVGPYTDAGVDLPPRVALHIPISFGVGGGSIAASVDNGASDVLAHAHAEHVGCSGPPPFVSHHWGALFRWRTLTKRLRHHVGHTLMMKLRAAGLAGRQSAHAAATCGGARVRTGWRRV